MTMPSTKPTKKVTFEQLLAAAENAPAYVVRDVFSDLAQYGMTEP